MRVSPSRPPCLGPGGGGHSPLTQGSWSLACGGPCLRVSYWVSSEELTAMTTRVEDVMTRHVVSLRKHVQYKEIVQVKAVRDRLSYPRW
jgi:hypothetical protein